MGNLTAIVGGDIESGLSVRAKINVLLDLYNKMAVSTPLYVLEYIDPSYIKKGSPTGQVLSDSGTWIDNGTQNLASVLSNDNKTGGIPITSDDGSTFLEINNGGVKIKSGYYSAGSVEVNNNSAILKSLDSTFSQYNIVSADNYEGVKMYVHDPVTGHGSSIGVYNFNYPVSFNGNDNRLVVIDSFSSKGLVYNSDYSANFTPESLVSKRYVDNATSALTLAEVVANGNTVNGIVAQSLSSYNYLEIEDNYMTLSTYAGGNSNQITLDNYNGNRFYSDIINRFDSPVNEFTNGGIYFVSGIGIDTTSTAGTDVLNIGATNANVINYGNASTIHNFLGTAIYELQVNSYVEDKLITLNYGGAVGSGIGVGFEIEEDAVITGYFKTNAARDAFSIKAPGHAFESEFSLSALTADRIHYLPNGSGILALESFVDSKVADAINNGITTVAPSQNAVFDALALKLDSIDAAHIKSPFHTTTIIDHAPNTIAASAIYSQLIPAGTLKGGDVLRLQYKLLRITGTGSAFTRIYHGLALNSLTNRIAQYSSTTSGVTTIVTRNYRIAPNGLSMSYISGAIAFSNDETVNTSTANEASLAIDVNADFYLTVGIEMSVATDVYRLHYVYSQIIRN